MYYVGQRVLIEITGMIGEYRAEVVSIGGDGTDATPYNPYLHIKEPWDCILKSGDYIVTEENF